jgi:hypothetical protein
MRVSGTVRDIALWSCGVLLLFALAPEAVADAQIPVSGSLAPAAALGLMLITAADKRR